MLEVSIPKARKEDALASSRGLKGILERTVSNRARKSRAGRSNSAALATLELGWTELGTDELIPQYNSTLDEHCLLARTPLPRHNEALIGTPSTFEDAPGTNDDVQRLIRAIGKQSDRFRQPYGTRNVRMCTHTYVDIVTVNLGFYCQG